ncbi:hypothetical protein [Actinacidiphila glaucinigra]
MPNTNSPHTPRRAATRVTDELGHRRLFESHAHARAWAALNGWSFEFAPGVLCPADDADARERQDQAEEIAEAMATSMEYRS